jgi:hypothetical protein
MTGDLINASRDRHGVRLKILTIRDSVSTFSRQCKAKLARVVERAFKRLFIHGVCFNSSSSHDTHRCLRIPSVCNTSVCSFDKSAKQKFETTALNSTAPRRNHPATGTSFPGGGWANPLVRAPRSAARRNVSAISRPSPQPWPARRSPVYRCRAGPRHWTSRCLTRRALAGRPSFAIMLTPSHR